MTEARDAERLAEERNERRAARDFAAADALRERIRALGYDVVDVPGGYELRPLGEEPPPPEQRMAADRVASVLGDEPTAEWTVHWLADGWPDDVVRGIASFRDHGATASVQHVVTEDGPQRAAWPDDVEVVPLEAGAGWARARNAGLRRTRGRLVALVDGSVEATGDVLTPLARVLGNASVGITEPVGAVTDDLREFRPAAGGDCDAIEGYLIAFRRELLERGLGFDPRFRFYRAADLDLSFQVKALGLRAVVTDVPIARHEHRAWANTPSDDRDRLSKRNFYRFLDRWRGRTDLLVSGG